MSKGVHYKVDCDECRRLGLTGSDKDLYFFIKAFDNSPDKLTMNQQRMSYHLCMNERTLRRSIQRLVGRGLVEVLDSGKRYSGGKILQYQLVKPTDKMTESIGHEVREVSDTMSEGDRQNVREVSDTMSEGLYNMYQYDKLNNIPNNNIPSEREGTAHTEGEGCIVESVDKLTAEILFECENGSTGIESIMRLYSLRPEQIKEAAKIFADKLKADGVNVKSRGDYRRHFNSWLKLNVKRIFFDNNGNGNGVTGDFIRRTAQRVAENGGLAF